MEAEFCHADQGCKISSRFTTLQSCHVMRVDLNNSICLVNCVHQNLRQCLLHSCLPLLCLHLSYWWNVHFSCTKSISPVSGHAPLSCTILAITSAVSACAPPSRACLAHCPIRPSSSNLSLASNHMCRCLSLPSWSVLCCSLVSLTPKPSTIHGLCTAGRTFSVSITEFN